MSARRRRPIVRVLDWIGWLAMSAAAILAAPWGGIRADTIDLRGGGQIQGKVVADPKNKDRVQVLLLQGRRPLSLQKGQIVRVTPKPGPLDDYVVKRAKIGSTAESQYELGYWCEQNRLRDLARLHYEQALAADPDFDAAHQKLGHTKVNGSWLTRDELTAAQGLVKYKGRWVTAEQRSKLEDAEKTTAAQGSWLRRIRMLRNALIKGPDDRRREAESQLMAIRDPDAVVPLVRVFGRDEVPRRILLALVLSAIGGREATAALVQRVLDEPNPEVRSITFDHLKQRHDAGVNARFARALGRQDVPVINRAAWALGNLNAVESVPQLVAALVTAEDRIVVPPLEAPSMPPLNAPVAPGIVPRAYSNFGIVASTPPAVTNGAIAAGMGVIPYYAQPGLIPGGNYANIGRAPIQDAHVETFTYRNTEVLGALQKLTGQDFGYDIPTWRQWVTQSFNPHPRPSRRVPQP